MLLYDLIRTTVVLTTWTYSLTKAEEIWSGHPPTDNDAVPEIPVQNFCYLLLNTELQQGRLVKFRISTTRETSPLWLQVWRPDTRWQYTLVYGIRIAQPIPSSTYQIQIPITERILTKNGDRLGFLHERNEFSVAYINNSSANTTGRVLTNLFQHGLPFPGTTYGFGIDVNNAWQFAVSAAIETDLSIHPTTSPATTTPQLTTQPTTMPTTQPDPTTMEPVELTTTPPSSTEAPPPGEFTTTSPQDVTTGVTNSGITISSSPPYDITTSIEDVSTIAVSTTAYSTAAASTAATTDAAVVTIGEVGGPGEPLAPQSGSTTAVIHEHPLPDGAILRYRLYVAVPDADVRLQVWRPQQRGETQREEEGEVYLLVYDKLYMFEEPGMKVVTLEDPVIVREYDRLGFTTSPDSTNSLIGHFVPTDENPAYQEVVMIREAPPTVELGRNYTFTGRFNIGFYIAADVDTVTNYTTDGIPGAPKTADDTALSTAAIIIIAVCAGLLLLFLLVCILCIAKRKRKEYPVEDYQPPVYEAAPKEWVITRENVNLYETLSETEAGLVVKGEVYGMHAKQGWSTVAIKLLKDTAGEYEKKAMLQEIESMKVIRPHHHVLQLLGCAIDRDPILLIAEYCAFGNLQDYLRDLKDRNLYMNIAGHSNYTITQELVGFMAQVARGMAYLSSMRILHRDLATRNILISDGRMCKITHFGFARDVIENHNYERLTKMRLPVRWLSPEALLSSNYSIKSDVWSMGVLMWEVVTLGATPYQNLDTDQVIKCVKKGYRLDKPPHCGDLLYGVMKKCWKTRAQERTTFELLSDNLQKLLDENNEMIQLEHYPEGQYHYLTSSSDHEIV